MIALDAHGTDAGPSVIVDGARAAAADGIGVRVFGDPEELGALEGVDGVEVVPAADAITNDDEPVRAVRSRPEASVVARRRRRRRGPLRRASSAPARPGPR